ncbi:Gfo/Idh/MocA family protein [Algoriphagus hitonicola]|uniref:Predicted dehydrogenase n=1 Tax=Algoriphagus hitonicola TaxID=435880 RepID=A0A1I2NS03_9BACT|nr:Gfo/Idh/MocA family oxidoreductase [Algoriphagus hitonicola]SFG06363.1 Predicted dehydrogenase [Algoriphagus hitonicola]
MKKFQDSEVRWGIIGVGNVCEVKSAPAMNLVPNSRLIAVMRRNEKKVKDYARRHHVPNWYTDAQALIEDPKVNAIYIATPPHLHLHYTRLAAEAGKPVYVEKPMARTYTECQEMIEICDKANVPLYVAYYRRALPHFVKIKDLIEKGAIGNIRTVHIQMRQEPEPEIIAQLENNWRVNPQIAGGGYFYDLASHQIDLLQFFLGKITDAYGFQTNQAGLYEAEDTVVGSFAFENGAVGTGNWSFASAQENQIDQIIIDGSLGQIRFETFGKGEFYLKKDRAEEAYFRFDLPPHIQQPLIALIVEDLLGKSACPSTGESASWTNWVLEKLTQQKIF